MEQRTTDGFEAARAGDFVAADRPLRDDVRRLGALVGEMLADQGGAAFLDEIESIRRAAIRRREADAPIADLAARLERVPAVRVELIVRAFAAWFQAINLAERVHRIRRRRDYQRQGAAAQPGGLEAVLAGLKSAGVELAELVALLPRLRIEPVLTAHPTEAVRRALLEKEQAIVRCLVDDLDGTRTPQERRVDSERIRMALTAAWQTAESPPEKPRVSDEFEHVSFYLTDVLYRVAPVFYEAFEDALRETWGQVPALPPVLRFGSWVGGDMDGNPHVGADTIAGALASQRGMVLDAYRRDLRHLAGLLSQTVPRVGIDAAVLERLERYRTLLPQAAQRLRPRHADMPYRQLLTLMAARLAESQRGGAGGYAGSHELLADLNLIGTSLRDHGGERAGWFAVERVLRRVQTFGFHLATLDIRQDASVHDTAIAALLGDPQWPQRPARARADSLAPLLSAAAIAPERVPEPAAATLAVFRTLARARREHGPEAIGPYIVSMSRSAADALAVLALARAGGCVDGRGQVSLDVAPLFETVHDLASAPAVVEALLVDPRYRAHLASRGDRQLVMLGYSDSAKDGGLAASRWGLQRAQVELSELARAWSIKLVFFHGRGGSISRGGGKTERAVIAAPRGSVDGVLRVTEQGEVIHRKYGIRSLALRTLEQATGAVLRATLRPRDKDGREAHWRTRMDDIAGNARAHYRALVHDHPRFADYFRAATPIDVIERLRIGSRPSKRSGAGGVDSLRAIPWVFAWSQNRAGLTAWFGVGTGLAHGVARFGLDGLQEMAREWPFFGTLIDDVEMVLAKSDLDIFERYSRLAGPLHAEFWPQIVAEFERTRELVLAIKQADQLLAGDRRLRLSIRLRNPYVDPISVLQVELLERWRAGDRADADLFHALVSTVNGIAAGVQNTG
jgi:phosphoenolpyruvate carboxylase